MKEEREKKKEVKGMNERRGEEEKEKKKERKRETAGEGWRKEGKKRIEESETKKTTGKRIDLGGKAPTNEREEDRGE